MRRMTDGRSEKSAGVSPRDKTAVSSDL